MASLPSLPPEIEHLLLNASVPPVYGRVQIGSFDTDWRSTDHVRIELSGLFFATVTGSPLVLVFDPDAVTGNNFGNDLTVEGEAEGRMVRFHAPQFYCRTPQHVPFEGNGWVILQPLHQPCHLVYSDGTATRAAAHLLNYDLRRDADREEGITVNAGGRAVCFRNVLSVKLTRFLLESRSISSAPLATAEFDINEGETTDDVLRTTRAIAGLCSIEARQHIGEAFVVFRNPLGMVVRIVFRNPVASKYSGEHLLPTLSRAWAGLPKLFDDCFVRHEQLMTQPDWSSAIQLAIACDQGVFLEHRVGHLYAAVESFLRLSLIEQGLETARSARKLTLHPLLVKAQCELGWPVPLANQESRRHLRLRDAAAHGNCLPFPSLGVFDTYEPWRLWLFRRILLRLGYTGQVTGFTEGFSTVSAVGDFSIQVNDLGLERRDSKRQAAKDEVQS